MEEDNHMMENKIFPFHGSRVKEGEGAEVGKRRVKGREWEVGVDTWQNFPFTRSITWKMRIQKDTHCTSNKQLLFDILSSFVNYIRTLHIEYHKELRFIKIYHHRERSSKENNNHK